MATLGGAQLQRQRTVQDEITVQQSTTLVKVRIVSNMLRCYFMTSDLSSCFGLAAQQRPSLL